MTVRARRFLLAFAALGLGASAASAYVHYSLLTVPGYTSICDVNATFSCTQAYLSRYGSLWGVPVAIGGLLYFAVVLVLAGIAGRPGSSARDNVPAYVFALSTLALSFVLYLAWASVFRLNAVCVLCAVTYAAVIGLFIVSGGASSLPMSSVPQRLSSDLRRLARSPAGVAIAAGLAAGAIALLNVFPGEAHAAPSTAAAAPETAGQAPAAGMPDQQRREFLKWYEAQPTVTVPVDPGGAKVLILKFNDYQCPPCRQSFLDYKPILEKYTADGRVKYLLKHYPLEPECNAAVQRELHGAACEAAAAVIMAERKGTASKLEDWFFANQPSLDAARVKEAAATVAGVADFDAQYERALTLVRTDAGLGALLGAKSTPTFLINGRLIAGALPPQFFEAAIEYELAR